MMIVTIMLIVCPPSSPESVPTLSGDDGAQTFEMNLITPSIQQAEVRAQHDGDHSQDATQADQQQDGGAAASTSDGLGAMACQAC